jgi:hypothetical protein
MVRDVATKERCRILEVGPNLAKERAGFLLADYRRRVDHTHGPSKLTILRVALTAAHTAQNRRTWREANREQHKLFERV